MARRRSLRSWLYRAARDVGDLEAAAKGPGAYGRRVARKREHRRAKGAVYRLLKSLGLGR